MFQLAVVDQMMRNRFYDGQLPRYGNMMWGGWWFQVYHIIVAVLFLVILILIAMLLWKKLQLMDYEDKKKR